MSRSAAILGSFAASVLLLTQCGVDPNGEAAGRRVPAVLSARAVSRHYVELEFAGAVGVEAADPGQYAIIAPTGDSLEVREASVVEPARTRVILRTDPQSQVAYELVLSSGGAVASSATFMGSMVQEIGVQTAVPLASDQVLVVFRAQPAATFSPNDFQIDGLEVVAVSATSADNLTVTLTTSEQGDQGYTLRMTGFHSATASVIDPLHPEASFNGIASEDRRSPTIRRTMSISPTAVLVEFSERLQPVNGLQTLFEIRERNTASALAYTRADLQFMNTHILVTTAVQQDGVEYELRIVDSRRPGVRDLSGNPFVEPSDTSALTFIRAAAAPRLQGSTEPRLVGAISTANTSVVVAFNKGMGDRAIDPANYVIVTDAVNSQAASLLVIAAKFLTSNRDENGPLDRSRVELTTLAQSTVVYRLSVNGVFDIDGTPLGPARLGSDADGLLMVGGNEAHFAGTGEGGIPLDSDGDGLTDAEEQLGWVVEVAIGTLGENATVLLREVTSDPHRADTDEDRVTDAQESHRRSDPRDPDTDNDEISDFDEFYLWGSSLNSQDTDADSIGDARELALYKTSPRFSDTDGDGLGDLEEILANNRNPLLADLPLPGIEIGEVALRLDARFAFTNTQGLSESVAKSSSTTLSQSDSRTLSTTDAVTNQHVVGGQINVDVIAGTFPNFKFQASYNYTHSHVFTATDSSTLQAQEQYQESLTTNVTRDVTEAVTRTLEGASAEVLVTITNGGTIPFTVRNLEITGLIQDPIDRTKFQPLASLLPASASGGGDFEVSLGPLIPQRGPFVFRNSEVFPSLVEDLMKNSRGLLFTVANFDIEDESGRNFAFTTQQVNDRTAGLVIDYGNGTVDRYRVSTQSPLSINACDDASTEPGVFCHVDEDCPGGRCLLGDGRPVGISMGAALREILGLRRNEPVNAIIVGSNECAETSAIGDDVQVVVPVCPPVPVRGVIIEPGPNGILETKPAGDDRKDQSGTKVVDGGDGCAHTRASRDDVQVVPGRCESASPDGFVVRPGRDGVFQTKAKGDDELATVTGYETVRRGGCDGNTGVLIEPGSNGILDSVPAGDDAVFGTAVRRILPGANGILESPIVGDDVRKGPGAACVSKSDCPGSGLCKTVERLARVMGAKERRDEARFWIILSPVDIPPDTDFDDIRLRSGDFFTLAFIEDRDGDGLSAREEFLYGSSDRDDNFDGCPLGDGAQGCDTDVFDFDSIPDFEEVRKGWSVQVEGQRSYFAFPNPVLPDTDADRLFDDEELVLGSDPGKRDTDGDDISDFDEVRGYDIVDRADTLIRSVVPYQSARIGAGADGTLDSSPVGDDRPGLSPAGRPIITPGCNGVLDTSVDGDDVLEPTKLILDGGNGISETTALGDDIQVCPAVDNAGCPQCPPPLGKRVTVRFLDFDPGNDACDEDLSFANRSGEFSFDLLVSTDHATEAGALLEDAAVAPTAVHTFDPSHTITVPVGPGESITISGDVVERDARCDSNTTDAIVDGGNGFADTLAQGDDEQVKALGTPVAAGDIIVSCGPNGQLDTTTPGCSGQEPPPAPCTGDDVLLERRGGDSCESGVCPCGTCLPDAHTDTWDFTRTFGPDELGDGETMSFVDGSGCFESATLRVRIDVLPGSGVSSGAVVVRPGPNGELDTAPGGDDFVGSEHLALYATDPLNRDTDGDTLFDGAEKDLGANPSDPLDASKFRDNDLDGLANIEETDGWFVGHRDGFGDLYCLSINTFPCNTCFFDVINGVREAEPNRLRKFTRVLDESVPPTECQFVTSDRFEPDTDFDGLPDLLERLVRSDPREEDTDGDGILDLDEFDPDSTFSISVSAAREFERRCAQAPRCVFRPESGAAGTSVVLGDTDSDGLDDRSEVFESFVLTPCINNAQGFRVVSSDPLSADADRDGVVDGDERSQDTDPRDPDTDDDGLVDKPDIDCQPTGCGTLVTVKFMSYFVGTDNCEPFEKAEMRFNLRVEVGTKTFYFNHSQDRVGTEETISFTDAGREFQLGEGESFTIAGRVFEDDGGAGFGGADEHWEFSRDFDGPPSGTLTIRPDGDGQDECFGEHRLNVDVTTRIGTAGCTGACCEDNGTCTDGRTRAGCVAGDGTYKGDGTGCAGVSCR